MNHCRAKHQEISLFSCHWYKKTTCVFVVITFNFVVKHAVGTHANLSKKMLVQFLIILICWRRRVRLIFSATASTFIPDNSRIHILFFYYRLPLKQWPFLSYDFRKKRSLALSKSPRFTFSSFACSMLRRGTKNVALNSWIRAHWIVAIVFTTIVEFDELSVTFFNFYFGLVFPSYNWAPTAQPISQNIATENRRIFLHLCCRFYFVKRFFLERNRMKRRGAKKMLNIWNECQKRECQ